MVTIVYLLGNALINLRMLKAISNEQTEALDEFLFADDMKKWCSNRRENTKKRWLKYLIYVTAMILQSTEMVYQPAPGKPYKDPTITMKGQRLQVVNKFIYLWSTLSRGVHIDDEVNAKIDKASATLVDYVEVFRIKMESDLTKSWQSIDLWRCQHYYNIRQFTNGIPKDWTTSIQAVLENF